VTLAAKKVTVAIECPACEERLTVPSGLRLDSKIRCPHCYADLVVIHQNPLELDWDDWGDDGDDGDDDYDDDLDDD